MARIVVIATTTSLVSAAHNVSILDDDGFSLLQLRATRQEPKYYLAPVGSACPAGETLSFDQCLEAQVKKIIPNVMTYQLMYNQRSWGWNQNGCILNPGNNNIYFSDEPVGGTSHSSRLQPICGSTGRFDEDIADNGISCKTPDCVSAGAPLMLWDDSIVLPELEILAAGAICEPCGVLSYAQCQKASDTGVIGDLQGMAIVACMEMQCSAGGHLVGQTAMPSGCSVHAPAPGNRINFCPYDTPDGVLAGLVSDSGAGVGFARVRPVCAVCTTTTTTEEPVAPPVVEAPVDEADEGAAVGDPHMSHGDSRKDLCCEGGICKSCEQ